MKSGQAVFRAEEAAREDEQRERRGDCRREQAVDAEGVYTEGLEVEEPERGEEHEQDERREQTARARVAEGGERREAEHCEVRERAHGGDREAARYGRVTALQNLVAARHDHAADALARQVLDRKVQRVRQADQRDEGRSGVPPDAAGARLTLPR